MELIEQTSQKMDFVEQEPQTKRSIGLNAKMTDSDWKGYEKHLSQSSKNAIINLDAFVNDVQNNVVQQQLVIPRTNVYRYILERKDPNFFKNFGLIRDEIQEEKSAKKSSKPSKQTKSSKDNTKKSSKAKSTLTLSNDIDIDINANANANANANTNTSLEINADTEAEIIANKMSSLKKTDLVKIQTANSRNSKIIKDLEPLTNIIPSPLSDISIIEFEIVKLISHMDWLIKNLRINSKSVLSDEDRILIEEPYYEAFFGVGKIIEGLQTLKVRDDVFNDIKPVPLIIIADLANKYKQFSNFVSSSPIELDYEKSSRRYPRIFYKTKYDNFLPGMSVKPYQSQEELLKFVSKGIKESTPFVCVNNTVMGMGKTTLVAILGRLIEKLEASKQEDEKKTLIYVCPEELRSVREVVGSVLHYLEMDYAFAYTQGNPNKNGETTVVIREQNRCKRSSRKPKVILASVSALIEMLGREINFNKHHKGRNYNYVFKPDNIVLFYDEITIGLDREQSTMVPIISKIYSLLPPQTIFASSTHPPIEHLESLQTYLREKNSEKYSGIVFKTINYSKILIGTQLNKMDGTMFIPHSNCHCPIELARFIQIVDSNSILKKHYTLSLVNQMYEKLIQIGIEIESGLEFRNYMDVPNHRNQESIQNLGMEYLKLVLEESRKDSTIIEKFNNIVATNVPINYSNLIETSRVLKGQTFISCSNPYSEMMKHFGTYFQNVLVHMGFNGFDDMYQNYVEQLAKSEKKLESGIQTGSKLDRMKEEFECKQDSMSNAFLGATIPSEFLLGNIGKKVSIPINYTEWNDIVASPFEKLAFMFGIVIFSEFSHRTYHDLVVDLISGGDNKMGGRAVYVFVDETFNYGNSFPFNNGIILKDMAHHSAKTLCQLMARAGRPGISDCAIIYADEEIYTVISNSIHDPSYVDYELINFNLAVLEA